MNLPPSCLLFIVVVSNLINYFDRAIIPGASTEIIGFLQECFGPNVSATTTSTWFGALVSAYIASYSLASLIFGHLARSARKPLRLVAAGLLIWCFAAVMCALAQPPHGTTASMWRFILLLSGRTLSGVGEAGFQCIIPGLIASVAPPDRKARWMAALFTPIPVGTAAGYMGGAIAASSASGWRGAYAIEAVLMVPIALVMCAADTTAPSTSEGEESASFLPANGHQDSQARGAADESLMSGVKAVLSSVDFNLITLGYSAHTAVFAGLAAFGPTLVLGLGFFGGSEKRASMGFGVAVALGGAIGTPLGGYITDKVGKAKVAPGDDCDAGKVDTLSERQQSLGIMVAMITATFCVALCTTFSPNETVFLALILLTVGIAYGAQASITMATLSCVSLDLQPLAMSLSTLGIHIFGDVPSPIVIGFMKGRLAPHCTAIIGENGKMSLNPLCHKDHIGLRMMLASVVSWLLVAVMFWALAWRLAGRKVRSSRNLNEPYQMFPSKS